MSDPKRFLGQCFDEFEASQREKSEFEVVASGNQQGVLGWLANTQITTFPMADLCRSRSDITGFDSPVDKSSDLKR